MLGMTCRVVLCVAQMDATGNKFHLIAVLGMPGDFVLSVCRWMLVATSSSQFKISSPVRRRPGQHAGAAQESQPVKRKQ